MSKWWVNQAKNRQGGFVQNYGDAAPPSSLPQVDTVLQLKGIRQPRKYCHKRKLSAAHDGEPAVNMVSSAAFEIEDSDKERAVRIELSNDLAKHSNMQRALRTTSWSKNRLY